VRYQSGKATCGPAALGNALLSLGLHRSEDELIKLCKTTAKDGTGTKRIIEATKAISAPSGDGNLPEITLTTAVIDEQRQSVALLTLLDATRRGWASVCLVDNWSHYVAVVGLLGDRVCVVDSASNELWHSLTLGDWVRRWECEDAKRPYWAMIITR
jgi:hypothetical protein